MGWLIAGGILGGLVLLVIAVLSLRLHLYLQSDENGAFCWRGRLFCFSFEKSDEPQTKSDSSTRKTVERLFGLSKFKSLKNIRESIDESGVSMTVSHFVSVFSTLVGRLLWLVPRCRVHKLALQVVCAGADGGDAAMTYGTVCATVYPLVGYVQTKLRAKKRAIQTDVRCDFNRERSDFAYDVHLSLSVWQMLRALLFIVKKNAEKEINV